MYHNIPLELRERRQWVCWRYETLPPSDKYPQGRVTKVPYAPDGTTHASVTDARTWGDFNTVVNASRAPNLNGIGFVLTHGDPYCIIDLDNKPEKPIDADEWKVHEHILNTFASYTERSVSGRGYHIVIRGSLPFGRRRGNVEVYSAERYMIFTGDVVRNSPIVDHQPLLERLVAEMPGATAQVELEQIEGILSDAEVHDMAMRAVNADKYDELCKGDWQAMGYTSQSEADLALLSILAFYTRDNDQVRRLFRYSNLGKRDKATQDNRYLDTTLRKIRAKQTAPTDFEAAAANAAAIIASATPSQRPAVLVDSNPPGENWIAERLAPPAPSAPEPPATPAAPPKPTHAPARAHAPTHAGTYSLPPGLVGELAQYFHSTAVRPLQEAALAAAIAVVAGVVGRSYNISGTGLNQYLLLVAKTGTGKEAMAKGIGKLFATVRPNVPMIDDFIGPSAFASGQGLIRVLDARPCFISILGEFGLTLQALSDPRAPAAMTILRKVLLDLYGKSGWEDILRSTAYSEQEKNTKAVHAPNVTILAESTPETFYDGLDAGDIADGLVPRFHIIEYKGTRPHRNRNAGHAPTPELAKRFADLAAVALTTQNNHTCAAIQIAPDALTILDSFDEECDDHMRSSHNAGETQLWNRAHLKALKLSGLLAVGCNPHAPTVTPELAEWAITFTRNGTEQVLARFFAGDVGQGEAKQMSELRRAIKDYFEMTPKQIEVYKCKPQWQKAGLIPYAYLVVRLSRVAAFYRDRNGSARSLKTALEQMVQSEFLGQVSTAEAFSKYGARQALYYVGSMW